MSVISAAKDNLVLEGSQWMLEGFPVLGMPDEVRAVKYFSLNPFVPNQENRCPLECAYCVCHQDAGWHQHPEKFEAINPEANLLPQLLNKILETPEGRAGFPISLCDYSDPFISAHRDRVLDILNALIDRNAKNLVYITTKMHPGTAFLNKLQTVLARSNRLKVTVFVSLPPLQPGYEVVSVSKRVQLIKDLVERDIPCCWYLRPLVEEWFDEELMTQLAVQLVPFVKDHIILSSIVMSNEVEKILLEKGLAVPDWSKDGVKQDLSWAFEKRLKKLLKEAAAVTETELGPVMGHRLCGTNGNHAYGCQLCGKKDRYCQLFQNYHYGETIQAIDPLNVGENQTVKGCKQC
jgi:DNA repair photolyase